ncbi:MAG: transposase [Candidatus Omnitrophota bacterium]
MPTYARIHQLNTSLIYHIYSRSNGKIPIFKSREDFIYFKSLLKRYSLRFDLKIYHWVIMSNHYHLLFELEQPKRISKIMAGLSKAYSCYYHKTYFTAGFLWQGRFKLQPVQKDSYLITCGRYIERNPVRAGMVNEAYEYPYSSAGYYCLGENNEITTENPIFISFGIDLVNRRNAYIEFLRKFDDEEQRLFNNLEHPVGNREFLKRLVRENGRFTSMRRGRLKKELLHKTLIGI